MKRSISIRRERAKRLSASPRRELCHSDLSVINGDRPRPLPMALGHEAAGIVEELGEDVNDLTVGDHVVMVFMPSCGHCLPLRRRTSGFMRAGCGGEWRGNVAW
ncbi:alcohol dehydrogenase catalytic domain-containing protein [Sphingomonas prati]|uniref:Zn-dependent alcohol dehydrogenase n=1 Tax=Sphingomonas prati TaxID=1843237 RepID=A0A7W9BVT6_9SPHN|nr:alcohol dehydrogenase catalytic domain-containing protein [Sphingomonas prati]MBB5730794.1 Zn-dependent alcohol dehydrogenase [Sphingomonas prati]